MTWTTIPAFGQVPFTPRYSETTQGAIYITGNTLLSCRPGDGNCDSAVREGAGGNSNNNDRNMVFVDVDGNPATFNSSSVSLQLPAGASVLYAALTWGGAGGAPSSGPDQRGNVLLRAAGSATYTPIAGSVIGQATISGYPAPFYFGIADVTAQLQAAGNGNYTVANVQTLTGSSTGGLAAGWALAIVYLDRTQPLRNLVLYSGLGFIASGQPPVSATISGFVVPPSGPTRAAIGFVGLEGDRGLGGDSIRFNGTPISDSLNSSDNAMNSTISYLGQPIANRTPNYTNQLGWDTKTIETNNLLANGATSATASMQTSGDSYLVNILSMAIDVFAPVMNITKTAANLTNPGGPYSGGDTIQYSVTVTATGADNATQTTLRDVIPQGTTYVPGSLQIVSGPGGGPTGAQTDAVGDDAAEFSPADNRVTFRLGSGASSTQGGTLAPGQTTVIRFSVKASNSVPTGATIPNTVSVSAMGETSRAIVESTASVDVNLTGAPDLTIDKTHSNPFVQGGSGSYNIVVRNLATTATSGQVTVSDQIPLELTATSATGNGWSCTVGRLVICRRSDVLAGGASYPPITLNVNIAPDAPAVITNVVTVSGGGDVTPANNQDSDVTVRVPVADLTILKSHTGSFTVGQTGTFTISVSNTPSTAPTVGLVTVSDPMPAGLTAIAATGTGWTCTVGPTVTCTRSDTLLPGASYPAINLAVDVAGNAPPQITNIVTVSGGGDVTPGNNTSSDVITVNPPPDLTIDKSHSGIINPGQSLSYTIVVSNNSASSSSSGQVTVSDTLPASLTARSATGIGWSCTVGPTVTCTRSNVLAPRASYPPITLTVDVASNAPLVITNTATVSGGGDVTPANNSDSDIGVSRPVPDLTIDKSHTGIINPGQSLTYTIVVSNVAGAEPSVGVVTVTDPIPPSMTATAAAGVGWNCSVGPIVTCTRSDVLLAGASYPPIALTVNVASNAPISITNTATVTGGGDITPANNSDSDTGVTRPVPDLTIDKSHTGIINPGQPFTYTIVVSNVPGAEPSVGAVTVTDPIPASMTATAAVGAGWNCTVGPIVTCTRSDVLLGGASYPPITLTVNVAANPPISITNTATVSGGGDVTPANNSDSDAGVTRPVPDLTIDKSHTGIINPGQSLTYTIVVSNATGAEPSVGAVTVTDPIPPSMTATAAAGVGWNCSVGPIVTCTRSDVLLGGASYPPITLTVNVAANPPISITNTATVSGGGDTTPANNSDSDTGVTRPVPDLTIDKSHTGSISPGQPFTYTIVVSNIPGAEPSVGAVTVTDPIPNGMTATAAAGDGWNCAVGSTVTCTRSDILLAGASYSPITLTVNVAPNPPTLITNTATVTGGGDVTPQNNVDSDVVAIIVPIDLSVSKSHSGAFQKGQTDAPFTITVTNMGSNPTVSEVTVTDVLPAGLMATAISGSGWTCTLAALTCVRSDSLPVNASFPPITLLVNVSPDASGTLVNTATVHLLGDENPTNNSATDSVIIGEPAPPTMSCIVSAVPETARAEGVSEQVGDIVLVCRGGTPTPVGVPVQPINLQVFLNTNITARRTGDFSDALVLIDEPGPDRQLACGATGSNDNGSGICSILGNGTGMDIYNGITAPNVFQARQAGVNSVIFAGLPIDPPGDGTRTLRITNIRANASLLGASATLVPTSVVAFVSSSGLLLSGGATKVVAYVQNGLTASVTAATLLQCLNTNSNLTNDSATLLGTSGQNGQQFAITLSEGFVSAWQVKNLAQEQANAGGGINYPPDLNQNIPGLGYRNETGFLNQNFPGLRGLNRAGSANAGTRFSIRFDPVPAGARLFVPAQVNLVAAGGITSGIAVLTREGPFSPFAGALIEVPMTGGVGAVSYEVLSADTTALETIEIPVAVAWSAATKPAADIQSKAIVGFSPLSTIDTASESAPIPRFISAQTAMDTFIVNTCSCTMLFPFVSNQLGFDTGVTISNTSLDPFGTEVQNGTMTIHYFGRMSDGSPAPAPQTTQIVNGGNQVVFTLSTGGTHGVQPTPGFHGYLFVQTEFLYCHGTAFISDLGAGRLAEGYVGLVLGDKNNIPRTRSVGESLSQ